MREPTLQEEVTALSAENVQLKADLEHERSLTPDRGLWLSWIGVEDLVENADESSAGRALLRQVLDRMPEASG